MKGKLRKKGNRPVRLSGIRRGRFGFPPESHRPKETYASDRGVQEAGRHISGRDCVAQLERYRNRPDVLAAALRDMGVTESGDEVEEAEGTS